MSISSPSHSDGVSVAATASLVGDFIASSGSIRSFTEPFVMNLVRCLPPIHDGDVVFQLELSSENKVVEFFQLSFVVILLTVTKVLALCAQPGQQCLKALRHMRIGVSTNVFCAS